MSMISEVSAQVVRDAVEVEVEKVDSAEHVMIEEPSVPVTEDEVQISEQCLKQRAAKYACEKALVAQAFSVQVFRKSQEDERVRSITEFWLAKYHRAAAVANLAWERTQPQRQQLAETMAPRIDAWRWTAGEKAVLAKDYSLAAAARLLTSCREAYAKSQENERIRKATEFCLDKGSLVATFLNDARLKTQPILEEKGTAAAQQVLKGGALAWERAQPVLAEKGPVVAAQVQNAAALAWEKGQPFVMEKGALVGGYLKATAEMIWGKAQAALQTKSDRPMSRSEARKSRKAA